MLGCKLDREKCYRTLANSLNTHYKNVKSNTINNISTTTANINANKNYQSEYRKAL